MGAVPALNEFRNIHFIDAGDARVCYRKAGQEGRVLVLLHGYLLSGLT